MSANTHQINTLATSTLRLDLIYKNREELKTERCFHCPTSNTIQKESKAPLFFRHIDLSRMEIEKQKLSKAESTTASHAYTTAH